MRILNLLPLLVVFGSCAQPLVDGRLKPTAIPGISGDLSADEPRPAVGPGRGATAKPADERADGATAGSGGQPSKPGNRADSAAPAPVSPTQVSAAPGSAAPGSAAPGAQAAQAVTPAAVASAKGGFAPVPPATVTEAEVDGYVEALQQQQGIDGLRALRPGTTLAERLRYCTAQLVLGAARQALPELQRLAAAHAQSPIVLRQLGHCHYWLDQRDQADECLLKALELGKKEDFATCPSLPSFVGAILLEHPSTRDQGMRILREELAAGKDFKRAVWALAGHLRRTESHAAALACIDAGLARAPGDGPMLVAKAQVCVELYDPKTAIALLEPIVAASDADRFALETMMRARVLRREFKPAIALVDRLLAREPRPQEKTWLESRREELVVAAKEGLQKMVTEWQVFAMLRGHPDMKLRVRALRDAVRQDNVRVREQALRIAFRSESPVLRAEALRLLLPRSTRPLDNLRAGFEDRQGSVRGAAATFASQVPKDRDQVAALVLEYLAKETDGYAFRQMHTALQKLTGREVPLPFGAVNDPDQRRALVAQWRKKSP